MLGMRYFDPASHIRIASQPLNPWAMLVVGIIHRAVLDYSMVAGSEYPMAINGCCVSAKEIEAFFKSRWFATLTFWAGIDGDDALKALKRRMKDAANT